MYMTVSRDGFIADANDQTPWSDDSWQAFEIFVKSCQIILLGRRTFEIMRDNQEFVDGPEYIVVTDNPELDTEGLTKLSIKSATDMPRADRVGVIGGGELNGRLMQFGVIDELFLDIEPIDLHNGSRLFGNHEPELKLELIGSSQIGEGGVRRHYKLL
jgi:dihydrofolate reductase